MHYMTNQEIFDKVATHLLTQKAKSMAIISDDYSCAYRGDDGLKCAVGCLIPDDKYDPTMEGHVAKTVLALFPRAINVHAYLSADLLDELRKVHDVMEVDMWYKGLNDVADHYNLDASVLEQFKEVNI